MISPDQQKYLEMIAQYCKLPIEEVDPGEVETLYKNPDSPPHDLRVKYLGKPNSYGKPYIERYSMLLHRAEALFDLPTNFQSYGVFAPSYIELLRDFPQTETPHKALLVGALTLDTIREFHATLKALFSRVDATVIDIEKPETDIPAGIARYEYGNAMSLRYDNQFDSVHSNFLTLAMVGSYGQSVMPHDIPVFYQGAFDTLKPGGRLTVVEGTHEEYMSWPEYEDTLKMIGFTDVRLQEVQAFGQRRDVFRFTDKPTPDLSWATIVTKGQGEDDLVTARAIRATKPK